MGPPINAIRGTKNNSSLDIFHAKFNEGKDLTFPPLLLLRLQVYSVVYKHLLDLFSLQLIAAVF